MCLGDLRRRVRADESLLESGNVQHEPIRAVVAVVEKLVHRVDLFAADDLHFGIDVVLCAQVDDLLRSPDAADAGSDEARLAGNGVADKAEDNEALVHAEEHELADPALAIEQREVRSVFVVRGDGVEEDVELAALAAMSSASALAMMPSAPIFFAIASFDLLREMTVTTQPIALAILTPITPSTPSPMMPTTRSPAFTFCFIRGSYMVTLAH